jgi:hypothetical protein
VSNPGFGYDLNEAIRAAALRPTRPALANEQEPVRAAIPPMRVPSFTEAPGVASHELDRRRDHLRGLGDPAHDTTYDDAPNEGLCHECWELAEGCLCIPGDS